VPHKPSPTSETVLVALNADIVNYSRLVADDAEHTANALAVARTVVEEGIVAAGGKLVNFVGDNFMAVFEHAEQAVHAAIAITNVIAERNADAPEYLRLRFRMGIDMGPVRISDDGAHLGHALNIAARIQAIAPPGGLSISGEIFSLMNRHSVSTRKENSTSRTSRSRWMFTISPIYQRKTPPHRIRNVLSFLKRRGSLYSPCTTRVLQTSWDLQATFFLATWSPG